MGSSRLRGESIPFFTEIMTELRQSDKSNTLTLTATGTGELSELVEKLEPQRASFAYVKIKYNNDEHSFREKFILVIWIGEEVKVMRRAKVSLETYDVAFRFR